MAQKIQFLLSFNHFSDVIILIVMLNLRAFAMESLSQIKSVAINTVIIELVSQLKCNYINSESRHGGRT